MPYTAWNRKLPKQPEVTREIILRSTGETLNLTFRKLGNLDRTRANEIGATLVERWVTGDSDFQQTEGQGGEPPCTFPPIGGEIIQPTENVCQQAALLCALQVGDPGDRLSPEDWILFQVMEDADTWGEILALASDVHKLPTDYQLSEPAPPVSQPVTLNVSPAYARKVEEWVTGDGDGEYPAEVTPNGQ